MAHIEEAQRSRAEAMLEGALTRARALRLPDDAVRTRAEEAMRWARTAEPASRGLRRWWPAVSGAFAVAAAIAVVVVVPRAAPSPAGEPAIVDVGPRVAVTASPGAVYAVVAATADATDIAVVSGAVTARLYPGPALYHLRLVAGDLEATATGTIFTVAAPPSRRPYAVVHEGHVQVHDGAAEHAIAAGESWPPSAPDLAITSSALRLGQHARHSVTAVLAPARAPRSETVSGTAPSAPPDPAPASAEPPASAGAAAPRGAVVTPLEDRWRRARQLRGQGQPRESLALLDDLIRRADPVWSPIAIAEAMRIHASVLGDPRATVQLGERFLAAYPRHTLRHEVTELVCRAHRALGATELPSACLIGD